MRDHSDDMLKAVQALDDNLENLQSNRTDGLEPIYIVDAISAVADHSRSLAYQMKDLYERLILVAKGGDPYPGGFRVGDLVEKRTPHLVDDAGSLSNACSGTGTITSLVRFGPALSEHSPLNAALVEWSGLAVPCLLDDLIRVTP